MRIWPSNSLEGIHLRISRNKNSSVPSLAAKPSSLNLTLTAESAEVISHLAQLPVRVFQRSSTTPVRSANIKLLRLPYAHSSFAIAHCAMARQSLSSQSRTRVEEPQETWLKLLEAVVRLQASQGESDKLLESERQPLLYEVVVI